MSLDINTNDIDFEGKYMIISVNPDVNFIHLIPKWPPPEVAQCIDRDIRANSLSFTIKLHYAKAVFFEEKLEFLSSTKIKRTPIWTLYMDLIIIYVLNKKMMIEDYYALVKS